MAFRPVLSTLAAVLLFSQSAQSRGSPPGAASLQGHWQGEMIEQGQALQVSFDFDQAPIQGRFTSLTQRVMDYPLDRIVQEGALVSLTLGGSIVLNGILVGPQFAGTFTNGEASGTFELRRADAINLPYSVVPVSFRNGKVLLRGTLCIPRSSGMHPAVILVHGSGAETRWGTSRYIADRMARAGIAALIYDKRGSGESGGDWRTSSYEELARDALAAVDLLRARSDIDARHIGIHGHSQGGVIGPLAATLAPQKLSFIVAEDTFAGPQYKQDIYRVSRAISGLKLTAPDESKAMEIYSLFVAAARGAVPYEAFEAAAAPYRNAAWYDWMQFPPPGSWIWTFGRLNGSFDTMPLWRQVRVPVLLIYGEKDALGPVDEYIAKISDALEQSNTPYTALIAPGAVHNLTVQPDENGTFFWWRQAPGIVDVVVDWTRRQTGRQ